MHRHSTEHKNNIYAHTNTNRDRDRQRQRAVSNAGHKEQQLAAATDRQTGRQADRRTDRQQARTIKLPHGVWLFCVAGIAVGMI